MQQLIFCRIPNLFQLPASCQCQWNLEKKYIVFTFPKINQHMLAWRQFLYAYTSCTRIRNSLVLGDSNGIFGYIDFNLNLFTDGWGLSCKIALRWISLGLNYHKSSVVLGMAWCSLTNELEQQKYNLVVLHEKLRNNFLVVVIISYMYL